jgi:deazaflavin-dependent oxidoreductase (nitroreductase family)
VSPDLRALANQDFCYLTTTGRVTGRPHEVEIWFAIEGETLYILSGGRDRSDWVRNILRTPEVTVRIGGERFEGRGRVVEDAGEDELARRLLVEKYERNPGSLSNWRRTALPVAVDLLER